MMKNVLLLENEAGFRDPIVKKLEAEGYNVTVPEDLDDSAAVEAAITDKYDLLLTALHYSAIPPKDDDMSKLSGYLITKFARERFPDLGIVFLSPNDSFFENLLLDGGANLVINQGTYEGRAESLMQELAKDKGPIIDSVTFCKQSITFSFNRFDTLARTKLRCIQEDFVDIIEGGTHESELGLNPEPSNRIWHSVTFDPASEKGFSIGDVNAIIECLHEHMAPRTIRKLKNEAEKLICNNNNYTEELAFFQR